jgi:hypothetical protein
MSGYPHPGGFKQVSFMIKYFIRYKKRYISVHV